MDRLKQYKHIIYCRQNGKAGYALLCDAWVVPVLCGGKLLCNFPCDDGVCFTAFGCSTLTRELLCVSFTHYER